MVQREPLPSTQFCFGLCVGSVSHELKVGASAALHTQHAHNAWRGLELAYDVQSPLHLLVTPEVL